jgi:hypothetical protein
MIEIFKKVGFFVSHCAVNFDILNFSGLEGFFNHCSFSSSSWTVDK